MSEIRIPNIDVTTLSKKLRKDLRSDHAGETGAVMIYKGILAVSRDPALRSFASTHLETEQKHLALFDSWLPKEDKSRLLLLWRVSGFLLGAFAALISKRLTYYTIQIVEQFVVEHYESQILTAPRDLREVLLKLQEEEKEHQLEAITLQDDSQSQVRKLWGLIVDAGSRLAVNVARLI